MLRHPHHFKYGCHFIGSVPSSLPLCGPRNTSSVNIPPPSCFKIPDNVYTLPGMAAHDYQTHLVTDGILVPRDSKKLRQLESRRAASQRLIHPLPRGSNTHQQLVNNTEGPRLLVVALGDLSLDQICHQNRDWAHYEQRDTDRKRPARTECSRLRSILRRACGRIRTSRSSNHFGVKNGF